MNKRDAVMQEKQILKLIQGADFLIQMKMSFTDDNNLYFIFEHCEWGTLSDLIKVQGNFILG